ncbi:MAG: FtsK/SpoIIIE domain-containing protein, partial [Erysipelotrichaceae bacterium]
YMELNKMPHLLVAGATGSGKSVCLNGIISNIILNANPEEVKLMLVDPKKVEFSAFEKIPHLLTPIITEASEAARALDIVVQIMDARYNAFREQGVRNIAAYHKLQDKGKNDELVDMPYIVVIIDELADLMLVAGKDVESSIQRITQLARAAGIHLIVATQRPSTNVITGVIKANIPSRIAFAVSSAIDSRVILDGNGAERLLGYGDMLYLPAGASSPLRIQGMYISDEEIDKICDFVSNQCAANFDPSFDNLDLDDDADDGFVVKNNDPLYDEVKEYVISSQKASASLLQRRFSIGYNRAAKLIDVLETRGVVGPQNGSKPRVVYAKTDEDY